MMSQTPEADLAPLTALVERATSLLRSDERVRILWLTGSLAGGTADAQSDVDLRLAVRPGDFATLAKWWPELVESVASTVWKRRWPGPPDAFIISAITQQYQRFDLVIQSTSDTRPQVSGATRVLFDKDDLARSIHLTAPAQRDPLASLPYVVDEFIRLVGMLPIVVERSDVPIGMEGQLALHSMLISLLLMENGIDRMVTGKRHVVALLNEEQRAILEAVPSLEPTMPSIIEGRLAYARLFLPRARRLMSAHHLPYPQAFEEATRQHLHDVLKLDL